MHASMRGAGHVCCLLPTLRGIISIIISYRVAMETNEGSVTREERNFLGGERKELAARTKTRGKKEACVNIIYM